MGRPPLDAPNTPSWIDYWIDNNNYCGFLGEDANYCVGAQRSIQRVTNCRPMNSSYRIPPVKAPDFAAQHDAFLDSLLDEQQQQQQVVRRPSQVTATEDEFLQDPAMNCSMSTVSTNSWTLTPTTSSNSSVSDTSIRKRRRSKLQPRRDPTLMHPPILKRDKTTLHIQSGSQTDNPKQHRPAPTFLHPQCRLQKDKAKGDQVGSNICAKGVEACLEKLRAKMQLLTEHCVQGATGTMKRRNAVVQESNGNFFETRSLLTLRMGFLSMTYGILLRWDAGASGLVTLVVLRKNCHESFYKMPLRSWVPESSSCCAGLPSAQQITPTSSASFDDEEGLEVAMLGPPYLVPRPAVFPPTEITVSVLYATGLHKKSHWTVQLCLADQTENILLAYDGNFMVPKLGGPLQYSVNNIPQTAILEIRLLEHRLRRKTRVLRCTMRVPISGLEAVSSDARDEPTSMRIACPDGATVQIESRMCSDAAVWKIRELEARRVQSKRTKRPLPVFVDEEDAASPWDWICMVC